jgi:Mrp family chromosome partitioning ATPase
LFTHRLKEEADFVIFDTPAAIAFTDCVVLTQWVDGVVMVVRANQVPRGAELQVRRLFNKANVKILGVVLNDVQPNSVDSYYYHSHYYPSSKPGHFALPGTIPPHKKHAIEEAEEDQEETSETVV